jgi:hypothetical protein
MGRHGVRAEWDEIPLATRAHVDDIAGSPVIAATNLEGGFSPGPAARCDLADGRRVFVKAAGAALNPISPIFHRREANVLRVLPDRHPSPRLIGVADDGDWVALVVEWVDGRMPTAPLDSHDIDRMLALVDRLAERGRRVRPEGIGKFAERHTGLTGHWQQLLDDDARIRDRLDPWSRNQLHRLAELETRALAASEGDHLLHVDLRTDNVLFSEAGADHDVVVDWPGAAIGAAWIDLVGMLPALHLDGAPPPLQLFSATSVGRAAEPDAVNAVLAAMAGYLTRQSLLDPPPGLPTVRAFQTAQGQVARAWLAERLGW